MYVNAVCLNCAVGCLESIRFFSRWSDTSLIQAVETRSRMCTFVPKELAVICVWQRWEGLEMLTGDPLNDFSVLKEGYRQSIAAFLDRSLRIACNRLSFFLSFFLCVCMYVCMYTLERVSVGKSWRVRWARCVVWLERHQHYWRVCEGQSQSVRTIATRQISWESKIEVNIWDIEVVCFHAKQRAVPLLQNLLTGCVTT